MVTERDGEIEVSHVRLHSPLPAGFPDHPRGCDYLEYLRYRMIGGPVDAAAADAIAVVQPGAWAGPYSLDRVARNTLRAAVTRGRTIEWWSLARRTSGATDMTGIDAARAAGDPRLAIDYYYGGAALDGRRFAGSKRDRELRYLGDLGAAQVVRDQYELLVRELPDATVRRERVFLGGHSLGGMLSGLFAAWDFDGEPGHAQCAGLMAIDSLVDVDPLALASRPIVRASLGAIAGPAHGAMLALIRRGLLPRTWSFLMLPTPDAFDFLRLLGLVALYAGDEETDLHRRFAERRGAGLLLRALGARSWRDVATGAADARELRVTGAGLLALTMGAGVMPVDAFAVSLGRSDGATAPRTSFPLAGWARRLPLVGTAAAMLLGAALTEAPVERAGRHGWTEPSDEEERPVVDLRDFARTLSGGPVGYLDSYMPARLHLDLVPAMLGARFGELAALRHERAAARKPTVHVIAGAEHIVPLLLKALRLTPPDAVSADGYTHIDMIAARRDGDGPEPVSDALADFLVRHSTAHAERVADHAVPLPKELV